MEREDDEKRIEKQTICQNKIEWKSPQEALSNAALN